jgi:transcriptional regulator with XRE-family HTH domain
MDDLTQRIAHAPNFEMLQTTGGCYTLPCMVVGNRLREIREAKNLSQGDIEKRTGLLRCYVSRVENGHTVPNVETLEKWARALEMPLYRIMYEGEEPPKPLKLSSASEEKLWGNSRQERSELNQLRLCLSKIDEKHRKLLLALAGKMAHTRSK